MRVHTSRNSGTPLRREWHVYGDYYRGTREQLIAAGIVRSGCFPGDPGQNRTSIGGRGRVRIQRCSVNVFTVFVPAPDDERDRRYEQAEAKARARRAAADASRELASLPTSKEGYRRLALAAVEALRTPPFGGGYSFDQESLEAIAEARQQLQAAIENAGIDFNSAERALVVRTIRARASVSDTAFQGFIATTKAWAAGSSVERS